MRRWPRRIALWLAALIALWLAALIVLDAVVERRQAKGTEERLGESLQATATIGATDLALVRGRLDFERMAIRRDDAVGHLSIDVADVRCELPPLGLALVDGECRELRVAGVRLEVSSAALFHLKPPQHAPIRARRVVIDDAELAFAPSALLPSFGRVAIAIEHAEAGPTVFKTPLSWIFALDRLRARVELPGGIVMHLSYGDGRLSAAGTLLGAAPVEVPLELPIADPARTAQDEVAALVALGREIAERLVAQRAEDWLKAKLQ